MEQIYDLIRLPLVEWGKAGLLPEFSQYAFVINALICALMAGPLLGGIGTMVVAKRLAFFRRQWGQAALIGVLLGEPVTAPYASLFGFCIIFALAMILCR